MDLKLTLKTYCQILENNFCGESGPGPSTVTLNLNLSINLLKKLS